MNTRMLATAAVLLAGCTQIEELDDKMEGGAVPTRVQEIFDARCNLPGCHGGGVISENLSLEAENSASIIGRNAQQVAMPLVDIGNVNGSYLAIKIMPDETLAEIGVSRAANTLRMPSGVVIDAAVQEDLAIILGWIAGADLPGGEMGGTGTDSGSDTADSGSESSGGEMIQLCGIEDLKPGAPNPLEASSGTGAMQIPPDIATILADNCGCHYADMLAVTTVADYTGAVDLATWAGWQAQHPALPRTVLDVVEERLDPTFVLPMPPLPPQCNVGGGEPMPPADRQILIDWIAAGAPDGASWMP